MRRTKAAAEDAPETAAPEWPADRVTRWPIEKLIPYARNARTHSREQIQQLKASIAEFGWTQPVLVDEAGVLIAGHGRVEAAYELGLVTVPTMVAVGWPEAKIKAHRLADNKLALNAGWDPEMLRLELGELGELGFDLDLTGFADGEIKDLFGAVEETEQPEAPEDFKEYDEDIETEHVCPKCGYAFSGGKTQPVEDA